ncbi:ATP-binding cassette domain-containing protein [Azovibrio restrictus]|uniref:ATP-binding cassette domain-containing protein n=1 Tax=Azovibrio restrictus TaxID=146938 RepID=UPI0003FABAFA|nr:ATP-binding cassette domain-containing protein [Azovibrio restrictus]
MRVFAAILREIPENLRPLFWMNALSALATTALIWLVSSATEDAAKGQFSSRSLLLFLVTVTAFGISHFYTLGTVSRDAERLIHKFRIRMFDLVRQADLITVERIGHGSLQRVLIQDAQTLAQTLPLLAIGFQQALMLLFLALYLAWLSPLACVLVFAMAGAVVTVRFRRVKALRLLMQEAQAAEEEVFGGLTDLLHGFKEVRMSTPRAEGVLETLAEASARARRSNASLKSQWGRNYAVVEAMFYCLIGLMVFVVPLFVTGYHQVVVPAMTAALFIAGPVGTVSFVTPMFTHADLALSNIEAMEARLRAAAAGEGAALPEAPRSIALEAAVGRRGGFTLGPLELRCQAGSITCISGPEGAGKSTLMALLATLQGLESGALLVDGKVLEAARQQDYRDRVALLSAQPRLFDRLYGLSLPPGPELQALLARFELSGRVFPDGDRLGTRGLSDSERGRLALLLAWIEDRPVMLFDDWAASQDPAFQQYFLTTLLPELKARGKIIIYASRDETAQPQADQVLHLEAGRLLA